MEKEIWKDIAGYEGIYQVSSHGKVVSLERDTLRDNGDLHYRRKERILKPMSDKDGYLSAALSNRNVKHFRIHRLVCTAFHDNPDNKPEVNHKNGVKWDNYYKNLEWSTSSENQKHACATGLQVTHSKGLYGNDSPFRKAVIQLDTDNNIIAEHDSIIEAGRVTGTDRTSISKVLKGKRNFAGGYRWKYKD